MTKQIFVLHLATQRFDFKVQITLVRIVWVSNCSSMTSVYAKLAHHTASLYLSHFIHRWGGGIAFQPMSLGKFAIVQPTPSSGFTATLPVEGGKQGRGSLFISFNKTVLSFPGLIRLCHRCHACISTSHLFLNCSAAQEFIKWTAATWFLSRPCCRWHHWVSETQQSVDTPRDISQTNVSHGERSFEGVPFCHVSIRMRVSLGFTAGRGQNPFTRKQVIHIIVTQTWGRIQILDFCVLQVRGRNLWTAF